jgi:diaminopimelate epimerase
MSIPFSKAHGLGNDFVLVEARLAPAEPGAWARRLCDRHVGIGADGLLLVEPRGTERIGMRLFNADGSEAEISGNGVRCVAAWGARRGVVGRTHLVETVAGPRPVEAAPVDGTRYRVATDLGTPLQDGPLEEPLEAAGRQLQVTTTCLGNPHCAVFLPEPPEDQLLSVLGPAIERHPRFPRRTNVEFVTVVSRAQLRVRMWERGVGYTRSSGTGAASAAAAAILRGLVNRRVEVSCDGGPLEVDWPLGATLRQVGEVELLFEGEWLA